MVTPEKCFQLYLSVKAHFTTESYDAVKYNGRIKNADKTHLEKRKDYPLFAMISKNFDTSQQAASYFVANFAYGNDYPLTDYERSSSNLTRWQRNRQSMTKMFTDDIDTLCELGISYNDLIAKDSLPRIYSILKNKKINIETLAIINQLDPFVNTWKNQILLKQEALRIQKLSSFIKFDEQKFRSIYQIFKDA